MRAQPTSDKPGTLRYAPRVPDTWQLLEADGDERQMFVDLDAVLALPAAAAAPPNRLRHVVRIERDGRCWFLKRFRRTQPKNRLHFALSPPTARDDADRERRVTAALREAGFETPRPVAYGRRGAESFYLCAAIDGTALAELLRCDVGLPAGTAAAAARFCGGLLAAGFRLPDLSSEHLFVRFDTTQRASFAVLDLHNGGSGRPGPPPHRLLRRVLRRFARSARELPVARHTAMRFAIRLLRSAGSARRQRRALLTAAQPFGTAARYELGGRSGDYAMRNPRRDVAEQALLRRVWPGRSGESVLDLPCGTGRLLPFLTGLGHHVAQADGARSMLRQLTARDTASAGRVVQADALRMPFADRSFDGVVMFRFLHHLPPDAAAAAIAEACRVARRFVVVSFFHPCSSHDLERRLRALFGRPRTRFSTTLRALQRRCAAHGFPHLHAKAAQLPLVRDLWLAAFTREAGADRR